MLKLKVSCPARMCSYLWKEKVWDPVVVVLGVKSYVVSMMFVLAELSSLRVVDWNCTCLQVDFIIGVVYN